MNGDMNRAIGTSFMCYFCNESIENTLLLQNHVKQCGSILEKCPKECGSWIERKHKVSHERHCGKTTRRDATQTLPSRNTIGPTLFNMLEEKKTDPKLNVALDNIEYLKKEMDNLRLIITEDRNYAGHLKTEVSKLKRQYVLSEERNQIVLATLTAMRRSTEEEISKQKILISELKDEFNGINLKNQDFKDFIVQVELRMDSLQKVVEYEKDERSRLEMIVNSQDGKLRNFDKIVTDLDTIKSEKNYTSTTANGQIITMQQEMADLKTIMSQENLLTKQQMQNIHAFQNDIEKRLDSISELMTKLENMNQEMKSIKQSMQEDSSTLSMMDRNLGTLSKQINNIQSNESHSDAIHNNFNSNYQATETSGHFLWRIEYYHQKLKDAIDNGSILQSPIFLSSKYGYTVQAEINLNGNGRARGRHLTATVYILPGEYDPILEWPATLQADIILKDQTPKRDKSVDIVKTLSVKKKEVEEEYPTLMGTDKKSDKKKTDSLSLTSDKSSSDPNTRKQYVFIPHTSLDKFDYIKNNVMFIEIIISKP